MKKNKGTKEFQELERRYAEDLFGELQCMSCKHDHGDGSCDAFKSIPFDILTGRHDHRKPYPGDNGILYEKKDEK
jgi:hypothetical protein